jgi:hypothetical protein
MRFVLIDDDAHHVPMLGFVLITLLLIVGPLAVLAGSDSRVDEIGRRRLGR